MWNADRGFGFIQNDAGGEDVFLHVTAFKTRASRLTKSEKAYGLHTRLKIPATARRRLAAFDWLESHVAWSELGLMAKNK
jgi:'Cold-shock' DNA-binding domain